MQAQSDQLLRQIRTTEAGQHCGERVTLHGWLQTIRKLGGVNFIILRDGWGTIQAVTEEAADLAPITDSNLQPESVITLQGTVVANAVAPGGFELQQPRIETITPVDEPLPVLISKRTVKAAIPSQLDHAVTVNRHPSRRAVYRLAANMMAAFRSYLNSQAFTEIQTPKLVASATESGANVFGVDYFGQTAYLAQSPQFYKQIMVGVFERVYEVGPVFRAEPHDTSRHINEYVSLDVEFGFIEDHHTVMALLTGLIAHILNELRLTSAEELTLTGATLPQMPNQIPAISFPAAQELVRELSGLDLRGEPDLSPEDERWVAQWAKEQHNSDFVFVTGYPMRKRPFYTHPDPGNPELSNSFDLLFRGVELVTGGQRLHRYADYLAALERGGYALEPFESYLEAFRYGMPPHGGFAIGLERFLMQLLDAKNLRLTTLFPRDMGRLTP